MFNDRERCLYRKRQLLEVICQLRFPAILSISAREPAEFQEGIRGDFPQYKRLLEQPQPRVVGGPGNFRVEEGEKITNYQFLSADGKWKASLTNTSVSLATPAYTTWEDFAAKLDLILSQFIPVYRPAYFERVGLRFINAFSRKALDLEGVPFRELFQPAYLGPMAEEDVREEGFSMASQDYELALAGGCRVKIHAGTGMLQRKLVEKNQVKLIQDNELRFFLDNDVFMPDKLPVAQCAPALQTVHIQADRLFAGAITDRLHEAMEPELI